MSIEDYPVDFYLISICISSTFSRNSQVRRVHFDSLVLSKIAGDVLPDGAAGIN